ncbi:MAG: pyridoxamine 5'-phosphate oxidase family protein [Alphaproteobacteria bacterium]|nr:pyridoxamine 5'-phosphate oxidase family protein [Alphaproteobacteria bacterium]
MPDTIALPPYAPTPRSRVRRHPERAHYDRATVHAILDAALMCHIGYAIDGKPYVTPTLFWREGERLYWHGSSASRMLRQQAEGIPVCLTVSHIDGLILARCAFRHSLNYRAVMAFGTAAIVTDPAEKEAGFNAFIERIYPGRTGIMRRIAPPELKATTLMGMTIEEASAKIRSGGPLDLEEDHAADCWAGTLPIAMRVGAPLPDEKVAPRGTLAAEAGHFAEGAALDQVLLTLAGEERRYG